MSGFTSDSSIASRSRYVKLLSNCMECRVMEIADTAVIKSSSRHLHLNNQFEISKELEILNFRLLAEAAYLRRDFNSWIVDETENKNEENSVAQSKAYEQNRNNTKVTQFTTFQKAMTVLLAFGQCVGLNPVAAILSNDFTKIRFTVYSWQFLYTIVAAIGQTTLAGLCTKVLFNTRFTIYSIGSSSFYLLASCTTLIFIRIANKWSILVKEIFNCNLDKYVDPSIVRKCNITCIVILLSALFEYFLAIFWKVCRINDCSTQEYNMYAEVTKMSFPMLYDIDTPFNTPLGILLQITDIISVMNRNYIDIFIICTSLYFASLLNQINKKIVLAANKNYLRPSTWSTLRKDYTRATRLIRLFDDILSGVVLISFASNLFFICLQLLNTLENGINLKQITAEICPSFGSGPMYGYEYSVYQIYSLTFLLTKFLTVSLVAASVNVASSVPAAALYRVPSCSYSKEVDRFLEQVHDDVVAFSGLGFFYITRETVLSVASTIATYELVLLQFSSDESNNN